MNNQFYVFNLNRAIDAWTLEAQVWNSFIEEKINNGSWTTNQLYNVNEHWENIKKEELVIQAINEKAKELKLASLTTSFEEDLVNLVTNFNITAAEQSDSILYQQMINGIQRRRELPTIEQLIEAEIYIKSCWTAGNRFFHKNTAFTVAFVGVLKTREHIPRFVVPVPQEPYNSAITIVPDSIEFYSIDWFPSE